MAGFLAELPSCSGSRPVGQLPRGGLSKSPTSIRTMLLTSRPSRLSVAITVRAIPSFGPSGWPSFAYATSTISAPKSGSNSASLKTAS